MRKSITGAVARRGAPAVGVSVHGPGGEPVCRKLMGSIGNIEFGDLSLHLQPNAWFHFLSDHAVVCWALPVGPDRTVLRTTWLVHRDAVEGEDYDVETLTAVWRATNDEDSALVARAHHGVTNPGYEPGPYSLVEDDVEAFVNWYIGRVRDHLGSLHGTMAVPRAEYEHQLDHRANKGFST